MGTTQIVPEGTLVIAVGGIAVGKSRYSAELAELLGDARAHVSVDDLREQVYGTQSIQSEPGYIHTVAHEIARARLAAGMSVIYDATSLLPRDRKGLIELAASFGAPVWALWVHCDDEIAAGRNAERDRTVPGWVVERMAARSRQVSIKVLTREGIDHVIDVDSGTVDSLKDLGQEPFGVPSGWDKSRFDLTEVGGFDVIGDIHGCHHSFEALLTALGYTDDGRHPEGRMLVSVGDIVDRGAHTWDVTTKVMALVRSGRMILVKGNHESKHSRYLAKMVEAYNSGQDAASVVGELRASQGEAHGLTTALEEALDRGDVVQWDLRSRWMQRLPEHMVLDGGRLVVVHGAIRKDLIGAAGKAADSWFLYGAPTGETGPEGFPIREAWQSAWDGDGFVVVGHSVVQEPEWGSGGGGSVNIDTGASFGGRLTALRWNGENPTEDSLVSVTVDPRDIVGDPRHRALGW